MQGIVCGFSPSLYMMHWFKVSRQALCQCGPWPKVPIPDAVGFKRDQGAKVDEGWSCAVPIVQSGPMHQCLPLSQQVFRAGHQEPCGYPITPPATATPPHTNDSNARAGGSKHAATRVGRWRALIVTLCLSSAHDLPDQSILRNFWPARIAIYL